VEEIKAVTKLQSLNVLSICCAAIWWRCVRAGERIN